VTFSSTYIRASIAAGDVVAAAAALGRPHRVEGVVVRGDQRGRELGYPTANLGMAEHVAIPADGVYAGWFVHRGR
jgi:riboflavin kinase/FMN adenylyltransferase